MRIAIVGAHGTGKTTLSKELSKLLNLPVIEDIVIEAHNKGFVINEDTPLETQFWLFAKQLELEKNTKNFIADKCLMDYSVYGDVLLKEERAKTLLAEMIQRNLNYDFVFYLPIEFELTTEGLRSLNPEFQRAIDERYLAKIKEWNVKCYKVTGTVKNRLKQILSVIIDNS